MENKWEKRKGNSWSDDSSSDTEQVSENCDEAAKADAEEVSELEPNKDSANSQSELNRTTMDADVTFVASDNTKIPAHRCALSAASVYFKTMFTSEFVERNMEKIPMPAINGPTLRVLIEFLYTGEIQITDENVEDILAGSGLLQVKEVKEQCTRFLGRSLRPSNVLGICNFAEFQDCTKLVEEAEKFISTYFTDVIQCEEFLLAEPERVAKMLASDGLMVSSEEQVLNALLIWVKFKLGERLPYLSKFLKHVRLALLSKGKLFGYLCKDEILKDDPHCFKKITSVANLSLAEKKKLQTSLARKPSTESHKIYVFSGSMLNGIVKVFDCLDQTWSLLPPMKLTRTRAQLVFVKQDLYVLGGIRGDSLKSVRVFDFWSQRWRSEKPMRINRSNFASCALTNNVFVCGGMQNSTVLSCAEMFTNQGRRVWNPLTKMLTGRAFHAVGVIGDRVYAVGGWSNGFFLNTMEYYNHNKKRWYRAEPMKTARSGPAVGVIDELMYVAGGWDGVYHKSCEVYDPVKGTWKFVSPMFKARRNAGCVVSNGRLFVIGGDDEGGICHKTVEFYDPRYDRWVLHPCPILYSGKFTSAAITVSAYKRPQKTEQNITLELDSWS